jgi:hypothetical protein
VPPPQPPQSGYVELFRDRVDELRDLLSDPLVGVAAATQAGLHLRLEQLDHVFDHAVQLFGGPASQLRQPRRRVDELHAHRLRALAAVDHAELDALTRLQLGHPGRQRALGQEHVAALIAGDEPESLRRVVPLHSTRGHR